MVVDENKAARLARPDLRRDPVAIIFILMCMLAAVGAWYVYGFRGERKTSSSVTAPVCDCICVPPNR